MKKPHTSSIARIFFDRSLILLILCFLGGNNQVFTQVATEPLDSDPSGIQIAPIAIPAFIGYTEKAMKDNQTLRDIPTVIHSLEEYRQLFGGAPILKFESTNGRVAISNRFYLYESVKLFYENGGGTCYILSVGNYDNPITLEELE
jgi:phage tail sheath protein FI